MLESIQADGKSCFRSLKSCQKDEKNPIFNADGSIFLGVYPQYEKVINGNIEIVQKRT